MVGSIVKLLISNTDGGNAHAFVLLTKNECNRLPIGKPNVNSLRFANLLSPIRFIWEYVYSVHGLKNLKNMVWNRDLIYDGKKLSSNVIIKLFCDLKEGFAKSKKVHQVWHMRFRFTFLDKFTNQNVSDAKQPFEEATIACQCQWLANIISYLVNFFDTLLEEHREKIGHADELLE